MFWKLVKCEIKSTGTVMLGIIIILALLAGVTVVSFGSDILSGFMTYALFSIGSAYAPYGILLILFRRYYRTMHAETAYFTHSLPVPVSAHYDVRMINAAIWVFLLLLIIIGGYYGTLESFPFQTESNLAEALYKLFQHFAIGKNKTSILFTVPLSLYFSSLNIVAIGYYAATRVANSNLRKYGMTGSVVLFFLMNAGQLAAMTMLRLVIRSSDTIERAVPNETVPTVIVFFQEMGIEVLIVSALMLGFLVWWTRRYLDTKLRLE